MLKSHCEIFKCRILRAFIFVSFAVCFFPPGCRQDRPVTAVSQDYVLRCGNISISAGSFSEELELKKSAYPYDIRSDPEKYNTLVMDLVTQLSQELVIRVAAAKNGISVSEKEIDRAEKKIRQDFPGDSFQQMLLENAVPYSLWRKRLGIKLLIDHFISKKLKNKIRISPKEIAEYYNLHKNSGEFGKDNKNNSDIEEKRLVDRLCEQKAESEYPAWIAGLRKRFPVLINKKTLRDFLELAVSEPK